MLVVIGIAFIIGAYPLTTVWPSGWTWHTGGQSNSLRTILGVYATLGVFLALAVLMPRNAMAAEA